MKDRWRSGVLAAALALASAAHAASLQQMHHELDVRLDPAKRELTVVDRVTLRGAGTTEVRLGQQFRVREAALDDVALPPAQAADGSWIWSLALREGRTHRLVLEYGGELAPLLDTDHRGTLEQLPPMSGPRGAFLPSGTGWYALIEDTPLTYRVDLALPPGYRGLVPGRLLDERETSGSWQARFEFLQPAEGIGLMAGPYLVRERMHPRPGGEGLRLRTWFHPEIDALAGDYLEALSGYLELYAQWIGAYPFTEFSVVSSPLPTGFGMPTLTYLGVDVLRLPFIRETSLGHEVLHNWWGNGVYVDYASGNWAEGLTTFMADYAYRERAGADSAREMRLAWLRDFAAIPPGEDMPLRGFTARTHGASQIVGYHKAAFLFLMLRERLGAQRFDAGVREFWRGHRFARAGWTDLQRAFEAVAQENLGAFFAQWLDRPGAPEIGLHRARTERTGAGIRVHVTLTQSDSPYALAVPLELRGAAGVETHVVQLSQSRQSFVLEAGSPPQALRLDPALHVFRRLSARELPPILRQVMLHPGTQLQLELPPALHETALALAQALLDHAPGSGSTAAAAPRLIVGTHEAVDAALARAGLAPRPPEVLAGRGTAQAWATYAADGMPVAVVSARDAAALQALARPLPHYGGQSWLVFEGAKAVARGVWAGEPVEVPLPAPEDRVSDARESRAGRD
jgi:hypothetical protein